MRHLWQHRLRQQGLAGWGEVRIVIKVKPIAGVDAKNGKRIEDLDAGSLCKPTKPRLGAGLAKHDRGERETEALKI